jgi:hypothetical protein
MRSSSRRDPYRRQASREPCSAATGTSGVTPACVRSADSTALVILAFTAWLRARAGSALHRLGFADIIEQRVGGVAEPSDQLELAT